MSSNQNRVATGTDGLDQLLLGGFPEEEVYLLRGGPGTGKTTLALRFLLEGHSRGEPTLYLTLSQTEEGLEKVAASHGWSLESVPIHSFAGAASKAEAPMEQSIFHTAEVELEETVAQMLEAVEEHAPKRIVLDSVAELRLLAESSLRFRRQIVELRRFLTAQGCTVLILDDEFDEGDQGLEGLTNGVITLRQRSPAYGSVRRYLEVIKMRGTHFHSGFHDFRIKAGGVEVYPRLEQSAGSEHARWNILESGVDEIDALMGGGMAEGTATVVMGPAGVGKTTLATLYAFAAAERGEHAAIFLFDERPETFYRRSESLGMDVKGHVAAGRILLEQLNTGDRTAGEFAHRVRQALETHGTKVVVIDTLTGYLNAMTQEQVLITQMHELLTFLNHQGVLSLLVVAQHGVVGSGVMSPVDVSYMADMVVLLRYFESAGELRKAISVVKKRYGNHEKAIREFQIMPKQVVVGAPIREFRGVLTGAPVYEGSDRQLLATDDDPT